MLQKCHTILVSKEIFQNKVEFIIIKTLQIIPFTSQCNRHEKGKGKDETKCNYFMFIFRMNFVIGIHDEKKRI